MVQKGGKHRSSEVQPSHDNDEAQAANDKLMASNRSAGAEGGQTYPLESRPILPVLCNASSYWLPSCAPNDFYILFNSIYVISGAPQPVGADFAINLAPRALLCLRRSL